MFKIALGPVHILRNSTMQLHFHLESNYLLFYVQFQEEHDV